jgi:hypothetical protein
MVEQDGYQDVTDLRQLLDNEKITLEDIEGIRTSDLEIEGSKVRVHYKLFDVNDMGKVGFSSGGLQNLSDLKLTSMLSTVLYDKQEERFFTEDELKIIFHGRLNMLGTILLFISKESGLVEDSNQGSFHEIAKNIQS